MRTPGNEMERIGKRTSVQTEQREKAMGERKRNRWHGWLAFLLIGMLLAASWPAAVQGQGPELDTDVSYSLEQRLRELEAIPHDFWAPSVEVTPQNLRLWRIEIVDTIGDAIGVSMALDAMHHPHILYQDADDYVVKYAYQDESGWHTETVDRGEYTSLALDLANQPHVSYCQRL